MIVALERWIYAPGSAKRVAALRIGLMGVLAVRVVRPVYRDLAGQPEALFRPRSFMNLLDAMPSVPVTIAVQIAAVALCALAAAGVRSRMTLPLGWAAAVFLNGMATSLGKVVHNDVLLLLAVVPLLAARAGDAWSVDARRTPAPRDAPAYGWPVRVAMLIVAGGYFFSGLQKIVNSGPGWVLSENLRWVLVTASDGQDRPNALALFVADRAWMFHLAAAFTIAVEAGAPAVLRWPRLLWLWIPSVAWMHLSILLAMGLDYSAWIATVLIVFVNWPAVPAWLRTLRAGRVPALR